MKCTVCLPDFEVVICTGSLIFILPQCLPDFEVENNGSLIFILHQCLPDFEVENNGSLIFILPQCLPDFEVVIMALLCLFCLNVFLILK